MTKAEEVVAAAESLIGSPYVYGAWGAKCTPALRRKYANYNQDQKAITYARCQQLRDTNVKSSCDGCKYNGLLAFDCRGLTDYCLKKVGIDLFGDYVGRQWSEKSNWDEQGDIAVLPELVCCLMERKSNGNWSHTGFYICNGWTIHCSGEVKKEPLSARKWTHYAIPKGLYSAEEIKAAHHGGFMRILKEGSRGDDVRELQEMLTKLGYECGAADGIFGAKTKAAVKAFQFSNSLQYDGICGPATWAALEGAINVPEDPAPEAPETDDEDEIDDETDDPEMTVQISYSNTITLLQCIRKMQEIIENTLK